MVRDPLSVRSEVPYVKLDGTHAAGSVELRLDRPVDWEPGEELVLMAPWEEVVLAEVSVRALAVTIQ